MDFACNTIEQYVNMVRLYQAKLIEIKDKIKDLRAKDEKIPELMKNAFEMFSAYEAEGLVEYSDNDRSKYIFHKNTNKNFLEAVKNCTEKYTSPYEELNDKIHFDILDSESILDAYGTIVDLRKEKEKMAKSGKSGTADYQALIELIDVVVYAFSLEIDNFRKNFLKDYYRELCELKNSFANNYDLISSLGKIIINNPNVKA